MNRLWLKRASALLMSAAMAASILPTGALAAADAQTDADAAASSAYAESADSAQNNSTSADNNAAADTTDPDADVGVAAPADDNAAQSESGGEEQSVSAPETSVQESDEQTEAVEAPAEPESFGGLWLTEINPNDYDGYNKGKYGLTKAEDLFEYVELLNNSDQVIHFNQDYELLYNDTAISARALDGSEDVVLQPGETLVLWNQRTNVENTATAEDFRARYYISDDVHIAVTDYGKNWATAGTFALRAKATGTVFSDYTYSNGTIDKTDSGDIADGLVLDLAIPDVGTSMTAARKKTFASPGYVYADQRGNGTKPENTSGLYVTEIYPNDGDRSATYGVSDDLMEFVEVTNTTGQDIRFNQDYQFRYLYKNQGTRLAICTYEDAHREALGEVGIDDLYDKDDVVIKAGSSAVFWCYRERNLKDSFQNGTAFPDEAAFRAAYGIGDDVDVYCMIGQNGMKNTDRGAAITQQKDGRQVMVSYYYYNGVTDTKDKKSVNLTLSAEGPRMTASAVQQAPTPGGTNGSQFSFPEDDGSKIVLSLREGSTVPESIMQGDELRVRFDYQATGSLPRTKITTYYRFDGTGTWQTNSEINRRVPGLYETNIPANELFDHDYVEFYVAASNQYHRNVTEVYRVNITKLDAVDGIRTNITDKEEVGGTVTVTANNGGDNADTTIQIDGKSYETSKMLEDGAYYTFQTSGRDSYFRNALVLADDNLTSDKDAVRIASLVKWQYYRLDGFAVHIDNQYFTYDAATDSYKIKLRFWAGTYGSSVYDYLEPDANREDFKVSQLQLKLINGKSYLPDSIGPESYTYPDTGETVDSKSKTNLSTDLSAEHSVGDSAGMCPYLDASFTIPAAEADAVGAVVDTTQLTDGVHTLTVTSGTATKTVKFIVDNKAPEVDLGIADGAVLSGDIKLAPQVTEENTLVENILTLDGERFNDTVETDSVTLGEGEHTLTVYARDAAGNETEKSVKFQVGNDVIAVVDAATNDVTTTSAALTVSVSGNVTDATAEFYKLEQLDAGQIETNSTDGILPYITYTLNVGEVQDTDTLFLNWNGTASNADDTHASKLFVQNTASGGWDEVGSADETGSIAARFTAADHVVDGRAVVMVQCTADSALPDLTGVTDGDTSAQSWDGYSIPENYDFAFAWETDTQYYSEEFFQHYLNMNNWIAQNADPLNIRYVIHTGDIVDDFDMIYEWENADKAMKILDDAKIPYGVLGGNHDVAAATFEYENYAKYFGEDRVKDQPTYGGSYKNNLGHYDLLTENGQDFIVVYMSWDIYEEEIDWMNQVLAQYSDRKAILCFHTYSRVAYNPDGSLGDYYGKLIQREVVAKNPNVFAVLNGHYHGSSFETTVFDDNKDGVYDRTVYQICTDYQSGFEGGSGYLKMLYFDLDNNKVYVNSYSPSLDDFNYYDNSSVTELGTQDPAAITPDTVNADGSAAAQRVNNALDTDILTLDVSFHTEPQKLLERCFSAYVDRGEKLGEAGVDAQSNTAALQLDSLNAQTSYAWYAVVRNALGSVDTTPVQLFTTKAAPADPGTNGGNQGGNGANGDQNGQTPNGSGGAAGSGAGQTGGQTNGTPAGTANAGTAGVQKTSAVKTGDRGLLLPACIGLAASATVAVTLGAYIRTKRKEEN